MVKTAYIDCFSGLSGDMFLGALINLGVDGEVLFKELESLGLRGYTVDIKQESRHEIKGTRVKIDCKTDHEHRSLTDIENIISLSNLPDKVVELSINMFRDLGRVEAEIHGVSVEEIHFHEVGAIDAMLDIVGTCLAFYMLGISNIVSSPVPLGTGFVKTHHGVIPVPAPATVALMQNIPCYTSNVTGEITTPTGATILRNLAKQFGPMPHMKIEKVGYGVGTKKYTQLPNLLRIIKGRIDEPLESESAVIVQANVDDQVPEQLPYLMDRLFEAGAMDVFWTPVQMKKNRPGVLIEVLCPTSLKHDIINTMLKESTTIGLRYQTIYRVKLKHQIISVDTDWGPVRVKVASHGGTIYNVSPEYDDCAKIALKSHIPLKDVYKHVIKNSLDLKVDEPFEDNLGNHQTENNFPNTPG